GRRAHRPARVALPRRRVQPGDRRSGTAVPHRLHLALRPRARSALALVRGSEETSYAASPDCEPEPPGCSPEPEQPFPRVGLAPVDVEPAPGGGRVPGKLVLLLPQDAYRALLRHFLQQAPLLVVAEETSLESDQRNR